MSSEDDLSWASENKRATGWVVEHASIYKFLARKFKTKSRICPQNKC